MGETEQPFLRKQAWDYFSTHASQRMTIFNFYIVLSSVTATSYFATFKNDSNLGLARPALAALLCLFAFIFWKLDQRNKFLIKNAEQALKYFEQADHGDDCTKVFTHEEMKTSAKTLKGWRRLIVWRRHLSYSDCFNLVFLVFFSIGVIGTASSALQWLRKLDIAADTGWKALAFEGTGFSSAALFDSDISLPAIGKTEGRTKFRHSPADESQYDLGYIVKVTVAPLDLKSVPSKYLQQTKEQHVGGDVTTDPIQQVVYVIHFSFTLSDGDDFSLAKLESSPHYLYSGTTNKFQDIAPTLVSAGVASRVRKVTCQVSVDKCETCR